MPVEVISDQRPEATPALLVVKSTRDGFTDWYRIGVTGENGGNLGQRIKVLNKNVEPPKLFTHVPVLWTLFWAIDLGAWVRGNMDQRAETARKMLADCIGGAFGIGANNFFVEANVPAEYRHLGDESCFVVTSDNVERLREVLRNLVNDLNNMEQG